MSLIQLHMQLSPDDIVLLEVRGRLSRDAWMNSLDPMSAACGEGIYSHKVMLNMANANYLDSTGVEWLLMSAEKFRAAGGKLVLHSASPITSDFLKMMRMHLVLDLVADEAAARSKLAGFNKGSP